MKILLIEDELKTAQFVKKGLEENGYEVDSVSDGKTGLHKALENSYQLIVTDVMLPELDGRELCKTLRKSGIETPILILTALGGTEEIVAGFGIGADDYLVKPFEFKELLARIKALLKRNSVTKQDEQILKIGDLSLDVNRKVVSRNGQPIILTVKEFALLEYFLRNPGKVISKAELALNIWKVDFDTGTNMVEVYVSYLRNKIDKNFADKLLHTQFGMGYILKLNNHANQV